MTSSSNDFILRNFQKDIPLDQRQVLQNALSQAKGPNLFSRYYAGEKYIQKNKESQIWFHGRTLLSGLDTQVNVSDDQKNKFEGLNFASNDYLGLARHSTAVEAGIEAAQNFGVNSAGSPLAFGATKYYMQLKDELAEFWKCNTLLYSSGWLAGFGAVKGLIKDYDNIVIDQLAQNCLQEGASASTKNLYKLKHLDEAHLEQLLKQIRKKEQQNAILVITESLFPMDSKSPNLNNYQQLCAKYKAFLLISSGHDFGVFGENGKGIWELQNLKDRSNVLMVATGSKTLSTNFGFVGCTDPHVIEYLKYFSTAYMFTNAINPVQSATALANLRIVRTQEGKRVRQKVLQNSLYLRKKLQSQKLTPLGSISPFVCIKAENEVISRLIVRLLLDNKIHVNAMESPSTKLGEPVIRITLMPQHTHEQIDRLAKCLSLSMKYAKDIFEKQKKKQSVNAKL